MEYPLMHPLRVSHSLASRSLKGAGRGRHVRTGLTEAYQWQLGLGTLLLGKPWLRTGSCPHRTGCRRRPAPPPASVHLWLHDSRTTACVASHCMQAVSCGNAASSWGRRPRVAPAAAMCLHRRRYKAVLAFKDMQLPGHMHVSCVLSAAPLRP